MNTLDTHAVTPASSSPQGEVTLPDAEKKEIEVMGQISRGTELSLNMPPRPAGCDGCRNGKGLLMSHGSVKESPSSSGGFLRGLKFQEKENFI